MHALDDPSARIEQGNAIAQRGGLAVALGQEDDAGSSKVGGRFSEGSARQQVLIAEGLLAVDQDHVGAAAGELPVLEAVVE